MVSETILDCDDYFKSLLADIHNAKQSIDIETYIYTDDHIGKQLAKALSAAAQREVAVRLLIDGAGTPLIPDCVKDMEAHGVQVRVFHPIAWSAWQWRQANIQMPSLFNKFFYLLSKINRRNHRKTCRIDNSIIYLGSINICQKHLSKVNGGEDWRDTVVKLEEVNSQELLLAFNMAWNGLQLKERFIKLFEHINPNSIFRLNYTRRMRRVLYKSLLRKLKFAKTRIWVTSAYFNPDYFLLRRLIKAAKRGVDVKVILQNKTDLSFMPIIARTFYNRMLNAGIQIYEYTPSVLHSKMLIIDDWFCVGSSNLNYRSLRHDLEVDLTIQTEQAKEVLQQFFLDNLAVSHQITATSHAKQPWYEKLLGQSLLYFRYFL